jgi:hypothetical protein
MRRTGWNNLRVEVYASGTTRITDPGNELGRAENIRFATGFPSGLYLEGECFVPRKTLRYWQVKGGRRIVIRNGQKLVYEGKIASEGFEVGENTEGAPVEAVGYWSGALMERRLRKRWSDQRLDDWAWAYQTAASGAELCSLDRNYRMRFTPKAEAWTSGDYAAVRYTMPTGQTVKKIDYDYDLQEGGQAWEIAIHNVGTSTDVVSVTSTGSAASQSHTLATPSQSIELRFYARANQTPTSDGTYYGEFSNITVYSETSQVNMEEICIDAVGTLSSELNSATTLITAAGTELDLTPFMEDDWAMWADVLARAVERGDGAYNPWAVQVVGSESIASPDGKPILKLWQFPAETDYDLAVRLAEQNLRGRVQIVRDNLRVRNWIVVGYTDANGVQQYVTPDDDSSLKDTDSITAYGQRDDVLELGESTSAIALAAGQRYLAYYKDPRYRVLGALTVAGYVRGRGKRVIPACEVTAGMRLRIEDVLVDAQGTGLTMLITRTQYEDNGEYLSMQFGELDTLLFPRMVFRHKGDPDAGIGLPEMGEGVGGGGGGGKRLNWKRRVGAKPGTPLWDKLSRMGWKEKQAYLAAWRKKRKKKG